MDQCYELPNLTRGDAFLHYITDGWKPSAITILQSGQPFTVLNNSSPSSTHHPSTPVAKVFKWSPQ